jgi:hypothetical protein
LAYLALTYDTGTQTWSGTGEVAIPTTEHDMLNKLGKDRWELAAVVPSDGKRHFYLKRREESPEVPAQA